MKVAATLIVYDQDPDHKKLSDLFHSTERAKTDFYVIAVDTKSVKGTEEWIRDYLGPKADVFPLTWTDNFAEARNLTLSRLPECDFWYWIDSDDVLQMTEGVTLPEFCSKLEGTDAVFFNYDYDKDQYGNSTTILTRGRIYRSSIKWEWRGRVHEDVYPPKGSDWGKDVGLARSDAFLWVHNTSERSSADERNMRLLRLSIEDDPDEPRNWYYLGNQHFASHRWLLAAEAYERYLSLSNWTEQKWDALIRQAIAYRSLNMLDEAIVSDTRAMLLVPKWADSYFGLGETYTRKHDWEKAVHFGELGLERVAKGDGIPDPVVFINMNAYTHNPYRWLEVAYWNLGDREKSLACLQKAAESRPEPDLLRQIDHMKWAMGRELIVKQGLNLAAGLLRRNEPLKAKSILESLPAGSGDDPNVQTAFQKVYERIYHLEDDTAYRNLYFTEEETIKPEDAIANIHELPRMRWALRRLQAMGAKKVLELGIGNATQALLFAKHGISVVGVDVDRRRVRDANWAAVRMGFLQTKTTSLGEDDEEAIEVPDITPESFVQFHFGSAEDLPEKVKALGPFDAVVAAELIEHVKDPEGLLNACEATSGHVLVTTPDGAYDGPQDPSPGHVRAYSYRELARILSPRGRLVEVHKVRSPLEGHQGDIVAEYVAKERVDGPPAVFFCPPVLTDWTPDAIYEGGIGGSETAVIRVAEELAKKGKRVTVYAQTEGVWNGVRYARVENFRPHPCELFVSWRTLGPIPQMAELAQHRFIWAHDVHFGDATPEQLDGVKVIALSRWHADYMKQKYPTAEIVVSGNGIDPERFEQSVERQRHRLIYAQSPDRGLDALLKTFPKIKEKYNDAELHVFYGFDLARDRMPEFVANVELLAQQPGVTLHGKVDQDTLAREYLKSDVLLYPATMPDGGPFLETYCISVVEAQAAGCVPITPTHGALGETNAMGLQAKDMDDALRALDDYWKAGKGWRERRRAMCVEWARQQTWAKIADQWCDLLAPVPA